MDQLLNLILNQKKWLKTWNKDQLWSSITGTRWLEAFRSISESWTTVWTVATSFLDHPVTQLFQSFKVKSEVFCCVTFMLCKLKQLSRCFTFYICKSCKLIKRQFCPQFSPWSSLIKKKPVISFYRLHIIKFNNDVASESSDWHTYLIIFFVK